MLTLYVGTGCPFSERVLDAGTDLDIEFDIKNVEEPGVREELVERGGKEQTPFLVDDENDVEMYDSDDIIAYLKERYPAAA